MPQTSLLQPGDIITGEYCVEQVFTSESLLFLTRHIPTQLQALTLYIPISEISEELGNGQAPKLIHHTSYQAFSILQAYMRWSEQNRKNQPLLSTRPSQFKYWQESEIYWVKTNQQVHLIAHYTLLSGQSVELLSEGDFTPPAPTSSDEWTFLSTQHWLKKKYSQQIQDQFICLNPYLPVSRQQLRKPLTPQFSEIFTSDQPHYYPLFMETSDSGMSTRMNAWLDRQLCTLCQRVPSQVLYQLSQIYREKNLHQTNFKESFPLTFLSLLPEIPQKQPPAFSSTLKLRVDQLAFFIHALIQKTLGEQNLIILNLGTNICEWLMPLLHFDWVHLAQVSSPTKTDANIDRESLDSNSMALLFASVFLEPSFSANEIAEIFGCPLMMVEELFQKLSSKGILIEHTFNEYSFTQKENTEKIKSWSQLQYQLSESFLDWQQEQNFENCFNKKNNWNNEFWLTHASKHPHFINQLLKVIKDNFKKQNYDLVIELSQQMQQCLPEELSNLNEHLKSVNFESKLCLFFAQWKKEQFRPALKLYQALFLGAENNTQHTAKLLHCFHQILKTEPITYAQPWLIILCDTTWSHLHSLPGINWIAYHWIQDFSEGTVAQDNLVLAQIMSPQAESLRSQRQDYQIEQLEFFSDLLAHLPDDFQFTTKWLVQTLRDFNYSSDALVQHEIRMALIAQEWSLTHNLAKKHQQPQLQCWFDWDWKQQQNTFNTILQQTHKPSFNQNSIDFWYEKTHTLLLRWLFSPFIPQPTTLHGDAFLVELGKQLSRHKDKLQNEILQQLDVLIKNHIPTQIELKEGWLYQFLDWWRSTLATGIPEKMNYGTKNNCYLWQKLLAENPFLEESAWIYAIMLTELISYWHSSNSDHFMDCQKKMSAWLDQEVSLRNQQEQYVLVRTGHTLVLLLQVKILLIPGKGFFQSRQLIKKLEKLEKDIAYSPIFLNSLNTIQRLVQLSKEEKNDHDAIANALYQTAQQEMPSIFWLWHESFLLESANAIPSLGDTQPLPQLNSSPRFDP